MRLRTIGVVQSKKRSGMVLTQPVIIHNFEKAIEYNLLGEETLVDIFELRLILEMGIADLIFSRKTKADIIALERIVTKQEKEEKNIIIFSLKNEISFHSKLYEMSNNNTLQRFQNLLLPLFKYVHNNMPSGAKDYKYSKGKFVSPRDLLEIIKDGNASTFRVAMRNHLEPHFNQILDLVKG